MRTKLVNNQQSSRPVKLNSPMQRKFFQLETITRTLASEAKTLRAFSNSRLEGISECPIFGIVHMQRQYPMHGRALALEAGEAMHQFFAAMRCWQLARIDQLPDHSMAAGIRIF